MWLLVQFSLRQMFSTSRVCHKSGIDHLYNEKSPFQSLQLEGEDLKKVNKSTHGPKSTSSIESIWSLGDYGRSRVRVKKIKFLLLINFRLLFLFKTPKSVDFRKSLVFSRHSFFSGDLALESGILSENEYLRWCVILLSSQVQSKKWTLEPDFRVSK